MQSAVCFEPRMCMTNKSIISFKSNSLFSGNLCATWVVDHTLVIYGIIQIIHFFLWSYHDQSGITNGPEYDQPVFVWGETWERNSWPLLETFDHFWVFLWPTTFFKNFAYARALGMCRRRNSSSRPKILGGPGACSDNRISLEFVAPGLVVEGYVVGFFYWSKTFEKTGFRQKLNFVKK